MKIPKHVIEISEDAFSDCQLFQKIEFPDDSNLQNIKKKGVFAWSSIESISIPSRWMVHLYN